MYDRRIRDVAVTERDQPTWTPTPRSEAVDESTVTSGSCSSPRPLNCKWNGCGEVFASLTALHSHLNRTHLQAELYEDAQPNHSHSHGYHHHHVNDQVDSAKRAYSSRENEYASYTDVHHNKRPSPLDILGHVASLQSATSCHSPSASTSAYHNGQYTADRASSSGTHQSSRPWAIPKQPQDQLQYHHYDTMVDQVPAYSPRYHHDLPISPRFGVTDSRQRFKRRQVGSSLGTDSSVLEKPLSAPVLSAHGLTAKMEQEHHGVNTGDHYMHKSNYMAGPYDSYPTRTARSADDASSSSYESRYGLKYLAAAKPQYNQTTNGKQGQHQQQKHATDTDMDGQTEIDLFEFCVGLTAFPSNVSMVPFE